MSRADQIRQAVETWEEYLAGIHSCDFEEPEAVAILHINAAAKEFANWLDGPTDEDIRSMAWEWLAIEYGNATIDGDPDWAAEAVSNGGFAFEACKRLLEAVRERREQQ